MAQLPVQCPSCSASLRITRLGCTACSTQLEGHFELPALLKLPHEDLIFVTEFVRASGSLKEMARLNGQSYPTIRNRLNRIIQRLGDETTNAQMRQHEILDAIAKGELSVEQAAKLLSGVER